MTEKQDAAHNAERTRRCPVCHSAAVATRAGASDDAYWRCETCGEIWNPARTKTRATSSWTS